MQLKRSLIRMTVIALLGVSSLVAADFDWMMNLNLRSDSDPVRYRSDLLSRFRMPEAQLGVILKSVGAPADAYMVLRLAELSGRSPDYVLQEYHKHHKQGWGAMAQSLGIKPGSSEFKALKGGHDMRFDDDDDYGKKSKDKEHGKKGH
ncbi:hypothetical protein [Sulfurospirillum cavolei]|uniref:hypothetical protein n=1 Tax=Sulfurospirillum cavolei TaxID=366522 RepID=UPI0005A8377D|nr:hypothetical protein [Sulfurospirillum cavolei]